MPTEHQRRLAREHSKRYRHSAKGKAARERYRKSPHGKARDQRYRQGKGKITWKRRQQLLFGKGLCPRCGKPRVPGKSRCQVHLDYAAQWKALHP